MIKKIQTIAIIYLSALIFASCGGDPNGIGLEEWNPYTSYNGKFIILNIE